MTAVRGADFYLPQNREIFETIFSMFTFAKPIDPVTVLDEMKVRGVYHDESSQQYIRELMRLTPTAANVLKYAAIVRDQALLRNVISVCEETVEAASSGAGEAGDVLDLCEKKIYALRQDRVVGGLMPVSQVVNSVYSNLSELAASGQPIPGIPTGFRDVDRRIMGMNKGDFILVAARPGMGKTSIGLNICLNAAKATGKTVAIFSLEMSREQLVTRFLSSEGEIPLGNLLTGNLTMDEWKRTAHACAAVSSLDILVNDNPTLTVAEMNAQCPPAQQSRPCDDRLSSAHAGLRQQEQLGKREPPAGRQRHFAHDEDHGKGAERAGAVPFAALARQRAAAGQAPDALGSA